MMTKILKTFLSIIGVIFLISLILPQAYATEQYVFGPEQFIRTKGKPNVYTDAFTASPGQGTITIFKYTYIRITEHGQGCQDCQHAITHPLGTLGLAGFCVPLCTAEVARGTQKACGTRHHRADV